MKGNFYEETIAESLKTGETIKIKPQSETGGADIEAGFRSRAMKENQIERQMSTAGRRTKWRQFSGTRNGKPWTVEVKET